MQACRKMENFSPNKYETVKSDVMFTRFLYAQLMNLRFSAPRNVGFSMPSSGSGQYKEFDMGMKLVCCKNLIYYTMSWIVTNCRFDVG